MELLWTLQRLNVLVQGPGVRYIGIDKCVKPAPKSLFGDVPGLDIHQAKNPVMNREEWKNNRPYKHCQPH